MTCKEKVETYLRENGVPYQLQHHPTAYTAPEVAHVEHVPGKLVAKVVMVVAGGKMAMLVLPSSYRVDLPKVDSLLGTTDVRLAQENEFAPLFPECETGAEPPFGNLYGLPVYVDRSLAEDESIIFQAGTHTDTISTRYADFERLVKPIAADFALQPGLRAA